MNIEILLNWGEKTRQIINNGFDFSEAEKSQLPKLAEKTVRSEGITLDGHEILKAQFQEKLPDLKHASAITLKENLIDFVKAQGSICEKGERLLGSSEIIESVFGRQKYLEQDYAKEGFTSLVLGIGAFVGEMSVDTVKKALACTPVKEITKWCFDVLGRTLQSKKIEAYSEVKNGTKSDLILCG